MLTFSVQNTCGETRRLHVIPPRTPVFSLNYEPIGGLAPGLDVRAEVEFQLPDDDEVDDLGTPFSPGEVREYVDKFVIISGEDKVGRGSTCIRSTEEKTQKQRHTVNLRPPLGSATSSFIMINDLGTLPYLLEKQSMNRT